jgi:hypothetical protein
MALPKVGDGYQVGDGNTAEGLKVGVSGGSIGFYGKAPASQRAASIQAASVVSASSVMSVASKVAEFAAEVAATLTALGLWKGSA